MREYGVGIVGTGAIAAVHAESVIQARGARLVACYNHTRAKGEAFARKYSIRFHETLEAFMSDPQVEIVMIATPSASHYEAAMAAIDHRKKAVIIEKPIEATVEAGDAIVEAARKAGVMLSGIFQSRFFPSSLAVRDAIDRGRFGRITMLGCQFNWYRSQEYYSDSPWHSAFGSGVLMNQGIHAIDLMCWFGGEVESVSAFCATLGHSGLEVEDTAAACLRFASGALGTIEGTTASWPGFLKRIEVCGTEGSVILEDESISAWQFRQELPEDEEIRRRFARASSAGGANDPMAISGSGHAASVQDVIDALNEGREPFITGEEAMKAVRVVEACLRSGGSPVAPGEEK